MVSFEWVSVAGGYRQQYRQREYAHVSSNQGRDRMRANKGWGQGGKSLLLKVLATVSVRLLVLQLLTTTPPALVSMAGPLTAPLLAYCSTSMPFYGQDRPARHSCRMVARQGYYELAGGKMCLCAGMLCVVAGSNEARVTIFSRLAAAVASCAAVATAASGSCPC